MAGLTLVANPEAGDWMVMVGPWLGVVRVKVDVQRGDVADTVGRHQMDGVRAVGGAVARQPGREGVIARGVERHADRAAAVELFLERGRSADGVADPAADRRARGHGRTWSRRGHGDRRRPGVQRERGVGGRGVARLIRGREVQAVRAVGGAVEGKCRGIGEVARASKAIGCAGPLSRLTSTDDTPVSASTALPVIVTSVRVKVPGDGALTVSTGGDVSGRVIRELPIRSRRPALGPITSTCVVP